VAQIFECEHGGHTHATEREAIACDMIHLAKRIGDRLPDPNYNFNKHEVIDWLANALVSEDGEAAAEVILKVGILLAAKRIKLWPPKPRPKKKSSAKLRLVTGDNQST